MKLFDWLNQHDLTFEQFAAMVNAPNATVVRRWTQGTIPSPRYMAAISEMTGYKVGPADFYDIKPTRSTHRRHPRKPSPLAPGPRRRRRKEAPAPQNTA